MLQIGKLELPPALLHGRTVWSPFLTTWSISPAGTGSGQVHARANLVRPGLAARG